MTWKIGPIGSPDQATEFSFEPPRPPRLKSITVHAAWAVDLLTVQYEGPGQEAAVVTPPTGKTNLPPQKFEVPEGDQLVAVHVGCGAQAPGYPKNEIITLQFETRKGIKSSVFGGGSGHAQVTVFVLRAPEGQHITGLHGATGGAKNLLIRLGAYTANL